MKREDWRAAAEAESRHTGDPKWSQDFRPSGPRQVLLVLGALLLTWGAFPLLRVFAAPGWGAAALVLYLLLVGFGLGRLRVSRDGVVLFGLVLALWLTWTNVLNKEEALGAGGVLMVALPGFFGWRLAKGGPWPWQRQYWEAL